MLDYLDDDPGPELTQPNRCLYGYAAGPLLLDA